MHTFSRPQGCPLAFKGRKQNLQFCRWLLGQRVVWRADSNGEIRFWIRRSLGGETADFWINFSDWVKNLWTYVIEHALSFGAIRFWIQRSLGGATADFLLNFSDLDENLGKEVMQYDNSFGAIRFCDLEVPWGCNSWLFMKYLRFTWKLGERGNWGCHFF